MSGEDSNDKELDDDAGIIDDPEATVVLTEDDVDDSLGDTSVELNVDALVAKIENVDSEELAQKRTAKKRLDQVQEQLDKDDQFGSTYAFDLDEDLPT